MPARTSAFFNEATGITTRGLAWINLNGSEQYPDAFDDLWRYLSFVSVTYKKTTVAATGVSVFDLLREGQAAADAVILWKRFMDTLETTVGPGDLQTAEMTSSANEYFVPPANIIATGLIIPPRTILRTFTSQTDMTLTGVLHEALDLNKLKGLV